MTPQSATQSRPTALQVAKCLVKIAHDEQELLLNVPGEDPQKDDLLTQRIDPLKLQKLVYFAQAVNLAVNNERLFDDKIEAWPLGPVVPSVYHEFKSNGSQWIGRDQGSGDGVSPEAHEFLRQIWLEFGKYSAIQLVEMTHRHAPWNNALLKPGRIIDEEDMKTFYRPMFVPIDDTTSQNA